MARFLKWPLSFWKWACLMGISQEQLWLSIVMFVYERVVAYSDVFSSRWNDYIWWICRVTCLFCHVLFWPPNLSKSKYYIYSWYGHIILQRYTRYEYIPSDNLSNSYWQWPFTVSCPIKNAGLLHSFLMFTRGYTSFLCVCPSLNINGNSRILKRRYIR